MQKPQSEKRPTDLSPPATRLEVPARTSRRDSQAELPKTGSVQSSKQSSPVHSVDASRRASYATVSSHGTAPSSRAESVARGEEGEGDVGNKHLGARVTFLEPDSK